MYRIVNKKTNQALSVSQLSSANGARVQVSQFNGGLHQLWRAVDIGQGLFQFTAQRSRKALIVPEASTEVESHLTQISLEAGENQKWQVDGGDGAFRRITRFGATKSLTVRENEPDQPVGFLRFFGQRGTGVFGLVVEGLESKRRHAADGAVASVRVAGSVLSVLQNDSIMALSQQLALRLMLWVSPAFTTAYRYSRDAYWTLRFE